MNSRENILADINVLKVLVCKLWEESHRAVDKDDWNSLREEVIKEMRK